MNKKFLMPLVVGGTALVVLFIASISGLSVPPSKLSPEDKAAAEHHEHDGHNHGPAEGGGMPMMEIPKLNFDDYLAKTKKKLHPQVLDKIEKLEAEHAQETDAHKKAHLVEELGQAYYDIKKYDLASYYFVEYGILENSEKYLTFASQIITEHIGSQQDAEVQFWMGANGVRAIEKMLESRPQDKDLRMDLALMYIDHAGQPMQGVAQLQSIIAEDSSDFRANIILGEMAIQSRQFDKAVERGKLILRYHPKSWEARVFMAYAYHNLGNKEEAIKLLNEAKQFNTAKEFHQDVDSYLQTMK